MAAPDFDIDQLERYSRQIVLPELGAAGQAALADGSVLVVGAGGLGAPALAYLGAAGVGTIGIADGDTVEQSNLHRQIVHGTDDVGRPKVDSAAAFVQARNPDARVHTYDEPLTKTTAIEWFETYDVVVDATDTFQARYLANDAAVVTETPLVHGAVDQLTGQLTTIVGGQPCYRCLRRVAPPPGSVPDCATAGILGVVPGVIGTLQATEAIKLLTNIGTPCQGQLLHYDATGLAFETVSLAPDPACPLCATQPTAETIEQTSYDGRCRL